MLAKNIDEQQEETVENGGNKMNELCDKLNRKEKLLRSLPTTLGCWVDQPTESPGTAWRMRTNRLEFCVCHCGAYIHSVVSANYRNRGMGKMKAPDAVENSAGCISPTYDYEL